MRLKVTFKKIMEFLLVGCGILLVLFPAFFILFHSFGTEGGVTLIPDALTLDNWKQVLFFESGYLVKFWISLGGCGLIVIGQLFVSLLGGFAFAKYQFPGKAVIYFLLIVLMMMPVQVTLVPNYIVLKSLHLIGTWWALILPAVFLPFGTVFLTQIIRTIPDEVLEAARLDGADTGRVLTGMILPMAKSGLVCLGVLTFVDAWNMVEQPMIFLSQPVEYPLSVFLATAQTMNPGISFACGVLTLLPVALLYLYYREELMEGLEFLGVK